jgi:hypothetical protein
MAVNLQTLPNFNPANLESSAGIIQEVLAEFARNFECCIPAIVQSYDRTKHEAVVQPAINMVLTTGEQVERANVLATVWRFMCGGYLIDLPISAGDTGWLVASDRDTSTFKAAPANPAKPNTYETHKYSAGFFIPDKFGSLSLAGEDSGNMVFQNAAGTEKISIGATNTKITSAELTISCPLTTFTGDIKVGSINSYSNHKHTGVQTGSGTSGVATN